MPASIRRRGRIGAGPPTACALVRRGGDRPGPAGRPGSSPQQAVPGSVPKKKATPWGDLKNAPGEIRTPDPLIRSQML